MRRSAFVAVSVRKRFQPCHHVRLPPAEQSGARKLHAWRHGVGVSAQVAAHGLRAAVEQPRQTFEVKQGVQWKSPTHMVGTGRPNWDFLLPPAAMRGRPVESEALRV
jgi:hypothetical protein